MRSLLILSVVLASVGCAPGFSVKPLAVSPDGITLKWDGNMASEQQVALTRAEAHCQLYKKHARPLAPPAVIGSSNAVSQSFRCVI